jgi:hypothetical protein
MTGFAGRTDYLAHTAARAAGARHREEALLKTNLTGALAGAADFWFRSWFGAGAGAGFAGFEFGNAQLGSHSFGCLLERYLQIVSEVGATL